MKTYIVSAMVVMAAFFTFGVAYAVADQLPAEFGISNIGPVVPDARDWSTKHGGLTAQISGEEIRFFAPGREIGVVLARDAESFSAKGTAAGGLGAAAADRSARPTSENWYGLPY